MKLTVLTSSLLLLSSLYAETNTTKKNPKADHKVSVKRSDDNKSETKKKKRLEAKVKAQMEREKRYAKEQKFYQGDEYDLKSHEVDPDSLADVPVIEPEDDFDITDVYRDDI